MTGEQKRKSASVPMSRRQLGALAGAAGLGAVVPASQAAESNRSDPPRVYYSPEISEAALFRIVDRLISDAGAKGKTGIKVHSSEANINLPLFLALRRHLPGSDFYETTWLDYDPAQTPKLASEIEATLRRLGLKDEPINILNRLPGSKTVPIRGGRHLKSIEVPSELLKYGVLVDLLNFKSPGFSGFVGHVKNLGIAYVTSCGKQAVHQPGYPKDPPFYERLEDAAKGVADAARGHIVYVTILSDYRCEDIGSVKARNGRLGILGSLDPVAADQASVDLIYDGKLTIAQMNALPMARKLKAGLYQLECAERIRFGSRTYRVMKL